MPSLSAFICAIIVTGISLLTGNLWASDTFRASANFGGYSGPDAHTLNNRALNLALQSGITNIRVYLPWEYIQNTPNLDSNQWNWAHTDQVINDAKHLGFQVIAYAHVTPQWARGGPERKGKIKRCEKAPNQGGWVPNSASHYYEFMKAAAARYRGKVDYWEIWNEPDLCQFWLGSEEQYRELILKPGIRAVREASPESAVVAGVLTRRGNPNQWLKLPANDPQYKYDYLSFHWYSKPRDLENGLFKRKLKSANKFVKRKGLKGFLITEFGFADKDVNSREDVCRTASGSPEEAAVKTLKICQSVASCKLASWFKLEETLFYRTCRMGLLDENLNPKSTLCSLSEYLTGISICR